MVSSLPCSSEVVRRATTYKRTEAGPRHHAADFKAGGLQVRFNADHNLQPVL